MSEYLNATCSICGEKYHRCDDCTKSKMNPWRSIVDTVDHYKIFLTIRDYNNKYITKEKAQEQLHNIDLTGLDNFIPEIKNVINEILN